MNTDESELSKLKTKWQDRAMTSQSAHYDAGNSYEKLFLYLGATVVAMSAAVGSAEVLVPSSVVEEWGAETVKSISGVISLFIAILAGLQTFLKFSQKSEKHKLAGAKYGDVRRSLEEISLLIGSQEDKAKSALHEVKKQLDSLALESPELPDKILKKHGGCDS
ncbi:SLATT domain-containing protein [Planctobacterium marinum]|uniref:SLATT domain-containing protein n=1 Tax=Planctobacterium marinum TaxID=1631968 RepID=UPI001E3ACAC5|nr:SLATT domain-containing protein [Planctobacterium marinum]MCC2604902.1 SLATT domain-containing protein [Planctobacterium marinum]